MTKDNWRRFDLWKQLSNPHDYKGFKQACEDADYPALSMLEFAQKVGIAEVSVSLYPELEPKDAYLKLVQEGSKESTLDAGVIPPANRPKTASGCGSCGGGKVL